LEQAQVFSEFFAENLGAISHNIQAVCEPSVRRRFGGPDKGFAGRGGFAWEWSEAQ
jgi:hypothetical protein